MGKKRRNGSQRQASVQFLPPSSIAPYVGQWIKTTITGVGNVVAYVIRYNSANGMVDLWVYRPGSSRREFMQYHYSDLVGIGPYYGPIPPYQAAPAPAPVPPSPYPPSYPPYYPPSYPPYNPYPSYPSPRRSCSNYKTRSQQLSCYLGLIPPV